MQVCFSAATVFNSCMIRLVVFPPMMCLAIYRYLYLSHNIVERKYVDTNEGMLSMIHSIIGSIFATARTNQNVSMPTVHIVD